MELVFKKPVIFEGKEYTSLDFSPMEDWTFDDVASISRKFNKLSGADAGPMDAVLPESNPEYDMLIAAKATGMPIDFFKRLPARETGALRSLIISFFLG